MSEAAEIIAEFGDTYTVRRTVPGAYVEGFYEPGALDEEFDIVASIQPMSDGEAAQLLAEGQRTAEMRKLFTVTRLKPVDEENQVKGDRVVIDGEEWEVQRVQAWMPLLDHYRCVIMRVNKANR